MVTKYNIFEIDCLKEYYVLCVKVINLELFNHINH